MQGLSDDRAKISRPKTDASPTVPTEISVQLMPARLRQASWIPVRNGLGFLGLAAEKRRHVQIVGGNILADFADVLLDRVDDVRQCVLHRCIRTFATGLPGLWQERLLLMDVFLIGVLEARGDHG